MHRQLLLVALRTSMTRGIMTDRENPPQGNDRRFHAAHKDKLHGEERQGFQPASVMVDLAASFKPGDILDIGVGTGYFTLPLLERLPDARVTGLDVSSEMLQTFETRATAAGLRDRITTVLYDLDKPKPWPLASGSFDLALAMSLTHEVADREAFAQEVHRILRSGGRLVIVDWDPASRAQHGPPTHHRIAPEQVISTMARHHLVLEERPSLYQDFYSLVFMKA